MKLAFLSLVLSCALIVTVSGADNEEGTTGSSLVNSLKPAGSSLMAFFVENKAALFCTFLVAVIAFAYSRPSRAAVQRRPSTHGKLGTQAREKEAEANVHAANSDRQLAASSFIEAAGLYSQQAQALIGKRRYEAAAIDYTKASTMYVEASIQESHMDLSADNRNFGKFKEQCAMHGSAAACYAKAAQEYAGAGDEKQAFQMSLAAIGQYQESASVALVGRDLESVARAHSAAADIYESIDEQQKAEDLKVAAAGEYARLVAKVVRQGDRAGAALALCNAAKNYEAGDRPEEVRAMNEAIVKLHEENDDGSTVSSDPLTVARYHHIVADAYGELGQTAKVEPILRVAAEHYEEAARALHQQKKMQNAAFSCTRAANLFARIGEQERARRLNDMASQLLAEM